MSSDRYLSDPIEARARLKSELERRTAVTPAMLHSIDGSGRLISVSDAWLAKLGYAREEVIGRRSSEFLTPESRERATKEVLPAFFRDGRCENVEYQMVCKDGRITDVLLSAVLEFDPSRNERVSLAVVTDVTALKAAERKLAESEARYRGLVEDQSEYLSLATLDGRLLFVNQAYASAHAKTADEMVGLNLFDLVPAEACAGVVESIATACRTKGAVRSRNQVVLSNGEQRWIAWTNRALRDADGRISAIHSVGRDIEEQVRAERLLQESEARYRGLVEDQSEYLSLATPDGVWRFVNRAFASIFGKTPEEMIGKNLFEHVAPEARSAVEQRLAATCRADEPVKGRSQVVLPSGERRWTAWTNRALRDADGRVSAIHSVGLDIEEQVRAERLLQESETRYRFLTENSSDVVAMLGPDGVRYYVSPSCRALTGYDAEEMKALRTQDTTHPDDIERVLATLREGEGTVSYRMRRRDGGYVWVETTCKPVVMDGEERRITVVRNIEERMKAETQLQESEARYRFLADNSGDLITLIDRHGKRLYASPACRALVGYEPEEMLAITTREAVHPDDLETILNALALGTPDQTYIYRMRRKDGSYVWVEAMGRPVEIEGRTDERLVIVRNIDQRIASEQRMKESEARYRLLADNSSDVVLLLDADLVRRYVSPACREILGYEPEEMIGIKSVEVAHPEDAARLALAFETLLSGRAEQQSIISRIRHRDGRWIWVEARLRSVKDSRTGAPSGIIGAVRDISARKAVEDELAEANRRLLALAGEDGLTGLYNRRAFDEAFAREYRRAARSKSPLALIMLDVDRFKAFNDRYGHPLGDECLRRVGATIRSAVRRPGDFVARYGGEEFVVLLPDADEAAAAEMAERIRRAVLDLAIEHAEGGERIVSVSAGVAAVVPYEAGGTPAALLEAADRALYAAKTGGRNLVMRASIGPAWPEDRARA